MQNPDILDDDYLETQGRFSLNCGLHSINNLFGREVRKQAEMDTICKQLSPNTFLNPHKHILGGEYDANVLIIALQQLGCEVKWHDKRYKVQPPRILKSTGVASSNNGFRLIGYLINKVTPGSFIKRLCRMENRHWFCVRPHKGKYAVFDSKQSRIRVIGDEHQAEGELEAYRKQGWEILVVNMKQLQQIGQEEQILQSDIRLTVKSNIEQEAPAKQQYQKKYCEDDVKTEQTPSNKSVDKPVEDEPINFSSPAPDKIDNTNKQ